MKSIIIKLSALLLVVIMACAAIVPVVADEPNTTFTDVADSKWYAKAVKYVAENRLMTGTAEGVFSPGVEFTRAMTVQVLSQLSGDDLSGYTSTDFADVPAGKWYTVAVAWAADKGIAAGDGYNFNPYASVTREQLALMIYQFAVKYVIVNDYAAGPENTDGFADADKIHYWAKEGINWAVYNGLLAGVGNDELDPTGTATRAQAAQIFYNLHYMKVNSILPPDTTDFDALTIDESDSTRVFVWGDSMSQGYVEDLSDLLPGIPCRNFASGGELCEHIAMKTGAMPLYVTPFTIPTAKEKVKIELLGENLKPVESLADWDTNGLSPVTIAGVKGHIGYYSDEDAYYFTRSDKAPYEAVEVTRLTRVISLGMSTMKTGDIHVICAYDEFNDIDTYINVLRRTVNRIGTDRYVFLVYPYLDYGEALIEEFGDHVIDVHTYFMTQALADAGIEPTEEDLENIADGRLPASLRSDDEHGNGIYDALLAKLVKKKLVELGFVECEHDANEATCAAASVCSLCGLELAPALDHTVVAPLYKVCSVCGGEVTPDTTDFDALTVTESDKTRFVCWGDSLTASGGSSDSNHTYPRVLARISGIPTRNYGVGGETSGHIAMRQGALPLYIAPFTIPAAAEPVKVQLLDGDMDHTDLGYFGNSGLSPITVAGVRGTFYYSSQDDCYYFTRDEDEFYEEIKVTVPTRVVTTGMADRKTNDIQVIFIGTNNGYSVNSVHKLIDTQRKMVEFSGSDKYIIVGMTCLDRMPDIADINAALGAEWGDNFLDIRTYMLTEGLEYLGIEPTEEDLADIERGEIPASLRSDDTHGNDYFYQLLAEQVYQKAIELGYLEPKA